MVRNVPTSRVGEIREKLVDESHECGMWQPISGAQSHDPWVSDELDEDRSQPEVATEALTQRDGVSLKGTFGRSGPHATVVGLGDGRGSKFTGLHGVVDALTIEGVDHATSVTDEQQTAVVGGGAVEGHR